MSYAVRPGQVAWQQAAQPISTARGTLNITALSSAAQAAAAHHVVLQLGKGRAVRP